MSATPQRLPSAGFLFWGVLPAVAAISALSRDPRGMWSNALGAYAFAWWLAGGYLQRSRSPRLVFPMLLIAMPWTGALVQAVRRIGYVVREGGLDGRNGDGSPMAFVLGVIFEQGFVFIPLTLIAWQLWRASDRRSARPAA